MAAGCVPLLFSCSTGAPVEPDQPGSLPTLNVTFVDTVLVPDDGLHFSSSRSSQPIVTIGATPALVRRRGDFEFTALVPREVFEPCLGWGERFDVVVVQDGDTATVNLSAAPMPVTFDLEVGERVYPSAAVLRSCPIALDAGRKYLIVPYRFPRDPLDIGDAAARDETAIRIAYQPAPVTISDALSLGDVFGALHATGRTPAVPNPADIAPSSPAHFGPGAYATPDIQPLAAMLPATASSGAGFGSGPCVVPGSVGDSIQLSVARDPSGRFLRLWNGLTPADPHFEFWTAIRSTANLVVFADTTAVRRLHQTAGLAARLDEVLDTFESSAVPFFETFTAGIPNVSTEQRRVAVFISGSSGVFPVGQALGSWVPRIDCDDPLSAIDRNGESIWLDLDNFDPGRHPDSAHPLHILIHEISHVIDLSAAHRPAGVQVRQWAVEGFAAYLTSMWSQRHYFGTESFVGNGAAKHADDLCVTLHRSTIANLYHHALGSGNYGAACALVGFLLEPHTEGGATEVGATLQRWVRTPDRREAARVQTALDGSHSDPTTFYGDWFLSWYADDFVSSPVRRLRSAAFNLRALNAVNAGKGPFHPYTLTLATLGVAGRVPIETSIEPAFTFDLGQHFDVDFQEVETGAATWMLVTRADGGGPGSPVDPSDNVRLGVLRVR